MKNLAGNKNCDMYIKQELIRCGIIIVSDQLRNGEVPSSIRGKLGSFTFVRAWCYWVVYGDVPLNVAQELHRDPVGQIDVRANGHCGCPSPEKCVVWRGKDGKKALLMREYDEIVKNLALVADHTIIRDILSRYRFVENPAAEATAVITSYHIDSETGLRLFADTLKKHGLV